MRAHGFRRAQPSDPRRPPQVTTGFRQAKPPMDVLTSDSEGGRLNKPPQYTVVVSTSSTTGYCPSAGSGPQATGNLPSSLPRRPPQRTVVVSTSSTTGDP